MFCPMCGAQNEDEAIYCESCGADLHPDEMSEGVAEEAVAVMAPSVDSGEATPQGAEAGDRSGAEATSEESGPAGPPYHPPSRSSSPAARPPVAPNSGMALASFVLGIAVPCDLR